MPQVGSSLATVLIAGFVAYVAHQQWRTAKAKLRLDLFDRRYANYQRTRDSIEAVLRSLRHDIDCGGDEFQDVLSAFFRQRNEAHLLFGDDVDAVLTKIHPEVQAVAMSIANAQSTSSSSDKIRFVQENLKHRNAIIKLQDELFAKCQRYIRIDAVF